MTIQIFDLCGREADLRFSPYCWRTKMALHHKGLSFETLPWRFTEKDRLSEFGHARVPVMMDSGKFVCDSWQIALYLDQAYPDRPPLMADQLARASAKFLNTWCDTQLIATLAPLAIKAVHSVLAEPDADYFRESREKRFGKPLEEVSSSGAQKDARERLEKVLQPLAAVLEDSPYLGGDQPYYGDYAVLGTLMWPYVVSPASLFETKSAVADWFERMLDLHGGAARKARTVRS